MTEYVVDVHIIYGQGAAAPPDYIKLSQDLSQGAGGQYVYLCYKKSSSEAPITGLNVFAGDSDDFAIQNGYTKVAGDLNKGAGGRYIYVCYNKDSSLPPISNISTVAGGNRHTYPSDKEIRINQDTNEGAGGKYIYICYSYNWLLADPLYPAKNLNKPELAN